MTNLVEALRPRIERIAASVAYRMKVSGAYAGGASWDTYRLGEHLVGELYAEDAIRWHRPPVFSGTEKAVIITDNIKALGLTDQDFGPDSILEGNLQERFHEHLEVAEGVTYEDTVSHTFTTTTTREDAYLQGLKIVAEEAIRIGAGSTESGITGNLRSEQEFHADFNQKYGTQKATSDTLSRKLSIPGPWVGSYEFTRSRDKKQQRVTAHADYDLSITFKDEHQVKYNRNPFLEAFGWQPPTRNLLEFGWASMPEVLAVMRREAPSSYALYQAYMDYPEDKGFIASIAAPPGESSFLLTFDDVTSADVVVRKTIKVPGGK